MKKVLTIAGSDCSGGAGVQADIKTITAHKLYALSVITALTAQNTMGVYGVSDVAPEFVEAQMRACFEDIVPDAVKIGMISNAQIASCIAGLLSDLGAKNIVLDPVMVATSGGKLIQTDAIAVLKEELFSLSTIITPNINEAQVLVDGKIEDIEDMQQAARELGEKYNTAVLIKGGHLGENDATDVLFYEGNFSVFSANKISTKNTHGTGCTLSSAIACNLANGKDLVQAVQNAKNFVATALKSDIKVGHGCGAIDHYFNIPPL